MLFRSGYRRAFPGIVRNRLKIKAAIGNARGYLQIMDETGSFDSFLWKYVDGSPLDSELETLAQIKVSSRESDMMSRDLKKLGFNFVGPTICYAFMQAVGMVNDHLVSCYRYPQIRRMSRRS